MDAEYQQVLQIPKFSNFISLFEAEDYGGSEGG
jgi:hypothetical protein